MTTSKQESQWVLRAQCDDREALELLLRSIQRPLRRYISRLVRPSHTEDVLQEVLVIVCRKLKSLHTPELLRPWVYRIASRQSFRYLKRERRCAEQAGHESVLSQFEALDIRSSSELLQELLSLKALSPASRAVLMLHFQEELSLSEVSAVLEIPIGTVKSRLAYGLSALRKYLIEKRSKS